MVGAIRGKKRPLRTKEARARSKHGSGPPNDKVDRMRKKGTLSQPTTSMPGEYIFLVIFYGF
jgi:hypothetical protein